MSIHNMPKMNDLTGKTFGDLTVINISHKDKNRKYYWNCKCICGIEKKVAGGHLVAGKILSCGCRKSALKLRKHNIYKIEGDICYIYTEKNEEFYCDTEDYELVSKYCWFINSKGYVCTSSIYTKKHIKLHRLLMNPPENLTVDHIDRNKRNNTKSNLRICTFAQNDYNTGISKRNKSGYIGVKQTKSKNYAVTIRKENKDIFLGTYSSIEEAIYARLKAEIDYFGEFAPQKHLFEEFGLMNYDEKVKNNDYSS